MRMIDEDEVGPKEKPEDTRYIKTDYIEIRPEAPGVQEKELDTNFCRPNDQKSTTLLTSTSTNPSTLSQVQVQIQINCDK